jgi:RNA polymerase sigma factor for flagellar operon FliA
MERKDLRDLLLHELGRTSRIIVILYYFEGLTMKEISRILDLSESRVSQRHAAILDHLRNRLQSPPPWTQD